MILVDSGPLVAAVNSRDNHHEVCARLLLTHPGPLLTYADLPLGAVDASVIAVAERVGASEVATLDRRHFSVVRPRHVGAFALLPEWL